MSRDFDSNNSTKSSERFLKRKKYRLFAYEENNGRGDKCIKDFNFVERMRYGHIDQYNNSIIPNPDFITNVGDGRVFDFVADSYSLAKLNLQAAINSGAVASNNFINNLTLITSYSDPRKRHGEYLDNILQVYNKSHIPNVVGTNNITSIEGYVKNFFKFYLNEAAGLPITLTGWNLSYNSNILQTGLAFSYSSIKMDEDQRKIDEIIDDPSFPYFKNLCTNMGFSIMHNNPNILVFDINSPANIPVLRYRQIYSLDNLFNSRFIKTCLLDMDILLNKINIYYNKYVESFSPIKIKSVVNCKTVIEYKSLDSSPITKRTLSDEEEIWTYIRIRNKEEGLPFSENKLRSIYKKAKYFLKKVDKAEAMSYTNSRFKDQVWNKYRGFHDMKARLSNKSKTEAQRKQTGRTSYSSQSGVSPSRGSSGRSSGGSSGGSSY